MGHTGTVVTFYDDKRDQALSAKLGNIIRKAGGPVPDFLEAAFEDVGEDDQEQQEEQDTEKADVAVDAKNRVPDWGDQNGTDTEAEEGERNADSSNLTHEMALQILNQANLLCSHT